MRYVMTARITACEEKFLNKETKLNENKQSVVTQVESLGWFITLDNMVSLALGTDKPNFQAGDTIRITLEKS